MIFDDEMTNMPEEGDEESTEETPVVEEAGDEPEDGSDETM